MKRRDRQQGWAWRRAFPVVVCVFSVSFAGCDFAEPAVEARGFLTKIHTGASGDNRRFVVFVLHDRDPNQSLPVILFLNGGGENGDDGLQHVSRNFGPQIWPKRGYVPFLGVAHQCTQGGKWTANSLDSARALAILDEVIEEYGGDPNRVILTGCSSGGSGVWRIGSAYPERFAAIVPLCGATGADATRIAESGMPVWNFYNRGDRSVVWFNRQLRQRLLEAGASPLVTEYDRDGHICWDRAYVSPALFAWMLEQNRPANHARRRFQLLPSETALNEWHRQGEATWKPDKQYEVSAVGVGDEASAYLASTERYDDVEFHFDVRFDPASKCRVGLISEVGDGDPKGYVLSLADARRASSNLSRLDGRWLATLDPVGQQSLLPGDWNDVRVTLQGKALSVRINGWPSLAYTDKALAEGRFRIALFAPEDASSVSFRYLRLRMPESETRT